MFSKDDPKYDTKEQKFLFTKEPLVTVRKSDNIPETSHLQENHVNNEENSKETFNTEEKIETTGTGSISITVWRNRKIQINRHLIPLKFAQFLWFSSGYIAFPFFSLLLTSRGLKMSEFSSVFSFLFLFQLTVAYVGGIIADKLGNGKPVLICLQLCTIFSLVALLLSPHVKDKFCLEKDKYASCFRVFNCPSYLENCNQTFSTTNNTKYFVTDNSKRICNISFLSSEDILDENSSKILEDAPYFNDTIIFCSEICSRFDEAKINCSSVSMKGYKILYIALTLLYFSFSSTVYRFLDFAVLVVARRHNSNFGKERMFGSLGYFVGASLCSFVLNIDKSKTEGYYDNVYWFVILIQAISLLSACKIKRVISPSGVKLSRKTLMLFSDVEILSTIIITFTLGLGFSFNSFYNLWFLNNLKASKIIISLCPVTSSFCSLPIYATSGWWLKKLEHKTVVIISLLCYIIRGICYSFLYYPWLSLIIDITEAFHFHLFLVSVVTHCQKIAPIGFSATVNAVVVSLHFAIGRSVSIPVGGYLISRFGSRASYRILAGFFSVMTVLYLLFLYLRHRCARRNSRKSEDVEETKSMRENEA